MWEAQLSTKERIAQLEQSIEFIRAQRNWLLSLDWFRSAADVEAAAESHELVIRRYQALVDRLKEG